MSSSPFSIDYQTRCDFGRLEQDEHLLAALGFSDASCAYSQHKPLFSLAMPDLESQQRVELWKSPDPVRYETVRFETGVLQLSRNNTVQFGYLQIAEGHYDNLANATDAAYRQILAALEDSELNKLLRIWNYFPAINDDSSGLERYRQFCLGRQKAIEAYGNFVYAPPAATAIGTQGGDLQIYFIAAATPGIQLENPRQTSAFLYPREYGEVSPAFSRATYKQWQQGQIQTPPQALLPETAKNITDVAEHLYISGTSSIVGHETRHPGNARQQLLESLDNIEALLQHGHETLNLGIRKLSELSHLKVYLRDPAFLPMAKAAFEKRMGDRQPATIYLQGDVCRADLLVEVEAGFFTAADTAR